MSVRNVHSVTDAGAREAVGPVSFTVSDMHCGHCVGKLRAAINRALPGAPVDIDLVAQRVTVDGDPAVAAEAIRNAGYTPRQA